MKRVLFLLLGVFFVLSAFSQAPQAFKYQAVVRDNAGNLITNQNVNFRIFILKGSVSGSDVYSETHSATTNGNGLVNLEIGKGTSSDDFSAIMWDSNSYFINLWVNGEEMGTSQLLSVPYALYADKAGQVELTQAQIDSLKGEKGDQGIQGETGETGIQGVPGEAGEKGEMGEKGDPGEYGKAIVLSRAEFAALENPEEGMMVLETPSNTLYVFDGISWQFIGSGGGDPLYFVVSAGPDIYSCDSTGSFEGMPLKEGEEGKWTPLFNPDMNYLISLDDDTDPGSGFTYHGDGSAYFAYNWVVSKTDTTNGQLLSHADQMSIYFLSSEDNLFELDTIYNGKAWGQPLPFKSDNWKYKDADVVWTILSGTGGEINEEYGNYILTGNANETYTLSYTLNNQCGEYGDTLSVYMLLGEMPEFREICLDTAHLNAADLPAGATGQWDCYNCPPGSNFSDVNDPKAYLQMPTGNTRVVDLRWIATYKGMSAQQMTFLSFNQTTLDADTLVVFNRTSYNLDRDKDWTILDGTGGSISGNQFSGQYGEEYTLEATWSNFCGDFTESVLLVFVEVEAGPSQQPCTDTAQLDGSVVPDWMHAEWSDEYSGGLGYFEDVSNPKTRFICSPGNDNGIMLKWTVKWRDEIIESSTWINFMGHLLAYAGEDLIDFMGAEVQLGIESGNPNGEWSILSGSGGTLNNPFNYNSVFTGNYGEIYELQWNEPASLCKQTDTVLISFMDPASHPGVINDRYYISDPAFRVYLQDNYPSVMDGDSLLVKSVFIDNILRFGWEGESVGTDIVDLDGIQFFSNLGSINFRSNDITNIPSFPPLITYINLSKNELVSIPDLPQNLRILECDRNPLESLPLLPETLESLIVSRDSLTSLPVLPPNLHTLECDQNKLSALPDLPRYLSSINCERNPLLSLPELPESLSELFCSQTNITAVPDLPEGLSYLDLRLIPGLAPLPVLPEYLQTLLISGSGITCVPNFPPNMTVDIVVILCE